MNWSGKRVLVTAGASFIGSHLVDALVERGAKVRVVDDLSSGKLHNIQTHLDAGRVECVRADLRDTGVAQQLIDEMSVVFHLAADHGGRGYVDLHKDWGMKSASCRYFTVYGERGHENHAVIAMIARAFVGG